MKIVTINSPIPWKLTKTKDGYTGVCGRLGLKLEAATLQEAVDLARQRAYDLFKEKYTNGQLNDFCFKHSAAYKVEEFNGYLDIQIPLILED